MSSLPEKERLLIEHPDLHGIPLEVCLRRGSRRRTRLAIRVTGGGEVEILLPPRTLKSEAIRALHTRIDWIRHHVSLARSRPIPAPLRYQSGETLWYLGNPITLQIIDTHTEANQRQSVRFIPRSERVTLTPDGSQLMIRLPSPVPDTLRKALTFWYRSEATRIITERLLTLCAQIPWLTTPPLWKLKTMKRRWGSCTARGELTFNTRLVRASPRCIDYVLLHEIAHLKELNHSPAYYAVLTSLLPDWKSARQELQHHAALFLDE